MANSQWLDGFAAFAMLILMVASHSSRLNPLSAGPSRLLSCRQMPVAWLGAVYPGSVGLGMIPGELLVQLDHFSDDNQHGWFQLCGGGICGQAVGDELSA